MDARIDGRPVTARDGYPVEIEALWINGLGVAVDLLGRVGRPTDDWVALRRQALSSFDRLFPVDASGLVDLIDPSGAARYERRPNQLLAASLPYGPVQDQAAAGHIVATCRSDLVTSIGLRSLSPRDPAYRGRHQGGPAERDAAYHQGTVWPWRSALHRCCPACRGDDRLLEGSAHLAEFGLGSVSETTDGDAPTTRRDVHSRHGPGRAHPLEMGRA
jgi:predicted glycogen debranching enzyme